MLAADESVLDDVLNEKEARLAKNDTLRNALDMARNEVERLRTQLALSEALSGMHLEPLDDGTYQVSNIPRWLDVCSALASKAYGR